MQFDFYMPVRILSGKNCVQNNAACFALGKKCLIVTGKHAAQLSGALDDVISVLKAEHIAWEIFDEIGENPLLSVCAQGGRAACESGADFIIGIGGGSPLDAAKAIAAFGTNPGIEDMALYDTAALHPSLPLILIPTTAGTGSEVNPYAVLTLDGQCKKKTFHSPFSYAKYAFLDSRYLHSMPPRGALSCALDAFCHCLESYLSPKATVLSAEFACLGAKGLWPVLQKATPEGWPSLTDADAQALLYGACAGGLAINTTGTGFPHPMGYNLTLDRGVSHGRACGAFTGEYIYRCMETSEGDARIRCFCQQIAASPQEVAQRIPALSDVTFQLTETEMERYISLVKSAGNFKNCVSPIGETQMRDIYRKLFLR